MDDRAVDGGVDPDLGYTVVVRRSPSSGWRDVMIRASSPLWMTLTLSLGCAGPTTSQEPGKPVDTGVAVESDSGDTAETAVDTGESLPYCPEDMVPVPADVPIYCIDRYETSLSEDGLSLVSKEGVLPAVGISFDEARVLCANTPVLADDEMAGWRRMPTLAEWSDAFDGVVGEGGSTYPTGEEWPEETCAVLAASGEQVVETLQPTGSFPECVGMLGAYDQLGNAWEWADPERNINVATFLERSAEGGLEISVDEAGQITWLSGSLDRFNLEVPGLFAGVGVSEDGIVVATDVTYQAEDPFDFVGYLVRRPGSSEEGRFVLLPVRVEAPEEGVREVPVAALEVRWPEDGQPVTAKMGCAYYSGFPEGCGGDTWFYGHPHDFRGTIGVRCAADPLY